MALLELQDYAGLVNRLGERATHRALDALDAAFDSCLRPGGQDVISRVTGSPEFIAVLRGPDTAATLQRLRAEAERQRDSGLVVCIANATSTGPDERLEQVYLRADEALSAARTALRLPETGSA